MRNHETETRNETGRIAGRKVSTMPSNTIPYVCQKCGTLYHDTIAPNLTKCPKCGAIGHSAIVGTKNITPRAHTDRRATTPRRTIAAPAPVAIPADALSRALLGKPGAPLDTPPLSPCVSCGATMTDTGVMGNCAKCNTASVDARERAMLNPRAPLGAIPTPRTSAHDATGDDSYARESEPTTLSALGAEYDTLRTSIADAEKRLGALLDSIQDARECARALLVDVNNAIQGR